MVEWRCSLTPCLFKNVTGNPMNQMPPNQEALPSPVMPHGQPGYFGVTSSPCSVYLKNTISNDLDITQQGPPNPQQMMPGQPYQRYPSQIAPRPIRTPSQMDYGVSWLPERLLLILDRFLIDDYCFLQGPNSNAPNQNQMNMDSSRSNFSSPSGLVIFELTSELTRAASALSERRYEPVEPTYASDQHPNAHAAAAASSRSPRRDESDARRLQRTAAHRAQSRPAASPNAGWQHPAESACTEPAGRGRAQSDDQRGRAHVSHAHAAAAG